MPFYEESFSNPLFFLKKNYGTYLDIYPFFPWYLSWMTQFLAYNPSMFDDHLSTFVWWESPKNKPESAFIFTLKIVLLSNYRNGKEKQLKPWWCFATISMVLNQSLNFVINYVDRQYSPSYPIWWQVYCIGFS